MIHPYEKHDAILNRDLSASERLEPARASLRFAMRLLKQFERDLLKASDRLTDEQLQTICNAVDNAWRASENCAFLGNPEFVAHPLERVSWN